MSGAQAAHSTVGCCCRPQECTCSDPYRPGRLIDATLTAIRIECDGGIDEQLRFNESYFGCGCPCAPSNFNQFPDYVDQATGTQWGYRSLGANVAPEGISEECTPFICTNAGCAGCRLNYISANFSEGIAYRRFTGPDVQWRTITDLNSSNICGTWSWRPTQVGYCFNENLGMRVRNYCYFPYKYAPENLPSYIEADRNGAYVDWRTGRYTGGNVGLIHAIRSADVDWIGSRCYYECTVKVQYWGSEQLAAYIGAYGQLIGTRETTFPAPIWTGVSVVGVYRKLCRSPHDTVLGGYTLAYPTGGDYYITDDDCGPISFLRDFRSTMPSGLTIS